VAEDITPEQQPPRGRPLKNKSWTALEIAEQVDFAAELICHGKAPWQIRNAMVEKYDLNRRTIEYRTHDARKQLARELCGMDRGEKVAEIVGAMQKVLEMSVANGRGSDAIGAVRLMSELLGLNPKN
jgi:hypothetical protein